MPSICRTWIGNAMPWLVEGSRISWDPPSSLVDAGCVHGGHMPNCLFGLFLYEAFHCEMYIFTL
jgi:hypothetical protein